MSMAVKSDRIKCQKVSVINVARSGRLGGWDVQRWKNVQTVRTRPCYFLPKNIKLKHKNNYCLPQKIAEDGRKMALFRDLENK